nr:MAG TPA: minor structural protein [Caudoviricetes sp.]
MAAGTLSVTNNSTAVVGTGTTFTALKAGDFLSLVVGQVPYTVAIASIESDTALTLVLPFDGPTATDLAWDGVKRDTMSLATMGVTVQAQKALRLMIADENNWRAIFGDAEEITVTLPNGQVMQGMSWGYLSQLMNQIDPVEMRNLQQQAAASEAAAQGFRNEAEGIKNTTAGIRDATDLIKTETQAIHDATNTIKGQTNQIKTETQAIKDQTNQIKTDTGVMRDEANTAKSDAQAASTAAQGFRDQAQEWAQSINADNLLTKSGNLAGLTDKTQAWLNVRPDGATPLAGDPVGDYDAATKRWVQNLINSGTIGPTMNGVMNYGVGDFHLRDSRAYIQPYEVVSDGQLLNRADWPELWAYAQMLSPIEDADWLADPANRGKYSLGDGTTTFRVPDRNGVQSGSIAGLYGRGDGVGNGTANSLINGEVFDSGAPNIIGDIGAVLSYGASGAFAYVRQAADVSGVPVGTGLGTQIVAFDAAKSSEVYGRYDNEIMGRNFVGVWVIRASGGFVAANTSWSVINGDATKPPAGTTADGGQLKSEYKVNGTVEGELFWRIRAAIGAEYYARLNVYNATANRTAVYDFDDLGTFSAKNLRSLGRIDSYGGITLQKQGFPSVYFNSSRYASPNTQVGAITLIQVTGADGAVSSVNLIRRRDDGTQTGQIVVTFPTSSGILALQGTSGREYKKDIADADASEAMDRISRQRLVNFVYKDDEKGRRRFGIIAEEAELIAPQYVKHIEVPVEDILDEDGNKIGEKTRDRPSVDVNPIVMDLMGCVQYLNKQVEELKAEIAALKK